MQHYRLALFLSLIACAPLSDEDRIAKAKTAVANEYDDPDSVKFSQVAVVQVEEVRSVCGVAVGTRSNDSEGRPARFVYIGGDEATVATPPDYLLPTSERQKHLGTAERLFGLMWQSYCEPGS